MKVKYSLKFLLLKTLYLPWEAQPVKKSSAIFGTLKFIGCEKGPAAGSHQIRMNHEISDVLSVVLRNVHVLCNITLRSVNRYRRFKVLYRLSLQRQAGYGRTVDVMVSLEAVRLFSATTRRFTNTPWHEYSTVGIKAWMCKLANIILKKFSYF